MTTRVPRPLVHPKVRQLMREAHQRHRSVEILSNNDPPAPQDRLSPTQLRRLPTFDTISACGSNLHQSRKSSPRRDTRARLKRPAVSLAHVPHRRNAMPLHRTGPTISLDRRSNNPDPRRTTHDTAPAALPTLTPLDPHRTRHLQPDQHDIPKRLTPKDRSSIQPPQPAAVGPIPPYLGLDSPPEVIHSHSNPIHLSERPPARTSPEPSALDPGPADPNRPSRSRARRPNSSRSARGRRRRYPGLTQPVQTVRRSLIRPQAAGAFDWNISVVHLTAGDWCPAGQAAARKACNSALSASISRSAGAQLFLSSSWAADAMCSASIPAAWSNSREVPDPGMSRTARWTIRGLAERARSASASSTAAPTPPSG